MGVDRFNKHCEPSTRNLARAHVDLVMTEQERRHGLSQNLGRERTLRVLSEVVAIEDPD